MAQANRITPKLPPQAFKTYQIVAPVSSHWRPATCAEVECPHHLHGWSTTVDLSTDLGRRQASYITRESKRRYQADKAGGTLVRYTFEAGQRCFLAASHKQRLEREELYVIRDGDWRQRTGARRQFKGRHAADDWVDDFAGHQDGLAHMRGHG